MLRGEALGTDPERLRGRFTPGVAPLFRALLLALGLCAMSYMQAWGTMEFILSSISVTGNPQTAAVQFNFSTSIAPYAVSSPTGREVDVTLQSTVSTHVKPLISQDLGVKDVHILHRGGELVAAILLDHNVTVRVQPQPNSLLVYLDAATSAPSVQASQQTLQSGQITRLVYLHHATFSEIAALLSSQTNTQTRSAPAETILAQSPISTGGYDSMGYSGTVQGGQLQLPLGDQLGAYRISDNAVIDKRLHAVILTGSAGTVNKLAAEIQAVDVPDQPQESVRIEARIYELTESAGKALGINFSNNGPVGQATLNVQSFQEPQTFATFQAELFAQIASGHGKLLSSPNLQTLDGSEASILTGDALPIVTTITYPGNPPTVQQQLQYVNVGVHLHVQPFVGDGGYVTSVVLVEVSNVTGFIQGNIPQISQRQAISTIRVRSGEPFVIGGLLQDNEIKSVSRVPLLSDIPILGELFKYRNETKERTNLIVVITPTVERQGQ